MTRSTVAGGAFAVLFTLVAVAALLRALEHDVAPDALAPAMTFATAAVHEGFLYGRVTTDDDSIYEGRLRWGGDEEALWGNYFNGFKDENPWVAQVPRDRMPKTRHSIEVLGIELAGWDRTIELGRPFMARFGDISRIDPRGRDIRVTLKSGTVFDLDRFSADDLADGLRVWDDARGVVDLGEWQIRTIELLPGGRSGAGASPLHGTVHTRQGDFTGLVQWDREACLGSDELDGYAADGELSLRFETIRSIARRSRDSSLVTLRDGREIVLSDTREVGNGNRGVYVDDPRYGRVLVSWDAFDSVDFTPGGTGPAYVDFRPGRPLTGRVVTRSGRHLTGRLVYDLDESETTETLDAPFQGVDYTIPFSLIASIVVPGPDQRGDPLARVTLQSGEELQLERTGDLGELNAGMLIFSDDRQRPEYVPWSDLVRVEFDRSP